MMQASAFDQWCHRLGLSPATRELLARLRAAPPVRRVQGRAQNVSGTYASRKMGLTIQFESHKVELWAIYAMEYDTQVLEYYDQPHTLTLTYQSPAGRTVRTSHTPDFLVLRQGGVGLKNGNRKSVSGPWPSRTPGAINTTRPGAGGVRRGRPRRPRWGAPTRSVPPPPSSPPTFGI
jgi:putative transposase